MNTTNELLCKNIWIFAPKIFQNIWSVCQIIWISRQNIEMIWSVFQIIWIFAPEIFEMFVKSFEFSRQKYCKTVVILYSYIFICMLYLFLFLWDHCTWDSFHSQNSSHCFDSLFSTRSACDNKQMLTKKSPRPTQISSGESLTFSLY